jgi:hypothetical protein
MMVEFGHAAALAHGVQPVPSAALFESVEQRGHDASAAGAQRMSDHDRTALTLVLSRSAPVSSAHASTTGDMDCVEG